MFNFSDTRIRFLVLVVLLVASFYFFQFSPGQVATILYPNTGGTFETGKPLEIRWTPGSPGIQGIDLIPYASYQKYGVDAYGETLRVYYKQEYAYNLTGGDTSGSYSFTPSTYQVPPGSYYIKISGANNSGVTYVSNAPITLVASQTAPPPTVTQSPLSYPSPVSSVPATPVKVISPNGGETFTVDGSIRISWIGGKNKVQVAIAKGDYRPGTGDSHMGWITKNGVPNSFVFWDGNICVTPDYCRPVTYWQPNGLVKILVVSENNDGDICLSADRPCNLDVSDNAFTIKSRGLLPLPSSTNIAPPLTPPLQPEKTSLIEIPEPKKTPVSPSLQRNITPPIRPIATPVRIKKSSSTGETPLLTVISPNGGETFAPGSSMKISWSSENDPTDMLVNIYLFSKNPEEHKDYIWTANVASYAKNTGTLNWKIPQDIKPDDRYFLRIGCQYPQGASYQGCTTDDSDNAFSIGNGTSSASGKIEQTSPSHTAPPSTSSEEHGEPPKGFWGRIKFIFGF